jgi:signal transduction histidine kinase
MWPGERPEAIDTRLVFRVYAMLCIIGGIAALATGILWLRSTTRLPSGPAATLFGLVGALNWAFALSAVGFSRIDDPAARLRSLKLFAAAHLVVGVYLAILYLQFGSTWARLEASITRLDTFEAVAFLTWRHYRLVSSALLVGAAVLAYIAFTASPGARFALTVRTTRDTADGPRALALRDKAWGASTRRLRSQFEEQLRLTARREERARLARDLHDAVKQQLFVIQTAAATVRTRFDADPAGAKAAIDQVRTAAREALAEMAAMLDQLQAMPIENVGLIEALRHQCEALGFRTGADVSLDAGTLPPARFLPAGAQEAMFRVAQEALANVGRHARARHISVTIREAGDGLALTVVDDGAGFDPMQKRSSMGIENMQARAQEIGGSLEITSSPGAGTTIAFTVPLVAHSPRRYLLTAAAFGVVFVSLAVLVAQGVRGLQPWLIAVTAIAGIGLVRYVVAFLRVRPTPEHA